MKFKLMFLLILCSFYSGRAQVAPHYGRLYNVQDFIEHAPNDIVGINRCLSTVAQRVWRETEFPGNMSDLVYTIVFPRRTYTINEAMSPIKMVGMTKKLIMERNMINGNPNRRVFIQIIGLRVDNGTFKQELSKYLGTNTQTESKIDYVSNPTNQFYWVAQSFMNNGIPINTLSALRQYIDANTGRTQIVCNNQMHKANFLSPNPSPMPVIQSVNTERHFFFMLKTQGLNSEEPHIYPKVKSRQLHHTIVQIRGFKLEGISSATNSHIYDTVSVQHNQNFTMGFAVYIENMKEVNVRNMVIDNVYGNGIYITNKFHALENGEVIADSNVIRNVWGLKFKRVCGNGSYDDTGSGICFVGINGGKSRYNLIHNQVDITKQAGHIALATCSEHNRNCEAAYNSLKGYDRLIHVENGLSGFNIHHNRITGSETGIVFDNNRDYKAGSCPPVNPSIVAYNYISNEEIVFNRNLQKIYPQHLLFATQAFRSHEYNGTVIENNTFVIDKRNVFSYTNNNRSVCFPNDPRGYNFNNQSDRYHIRSGIRRQVIRNNTFRVLNPQVIHPFVVGGTFLNSFCVDEIVDPNPCPVPQGEVPCGYVLGQTPQQNPRLLNESLPIEVSGNTYIHCERVYLHHSISSQPKVFSNLFQQAPKQGAIPPLDKYTQAKPMQY